MFEHDAAVLSYVHLSHFPRADEALHSLQKIASVVKPIMRARGWTVRELAEFYPNQQNLLGLNVNKGQKIYVRLRYPTDKNQFMPFEAVVDTMLHELSHIVHGPHNQDFHNLWDQLRDEHEGLAMKGYTGEGFLSAGRVLGGSGKLSRQEARRLARQEAEKYRIWSQVKGTGSGGRQLGGSATIGRPGRAGMRAAIAAAAEKRRTLEGCGGSQTLSEREIIDISDSATENGFRTQAKEDEENDVAIAQALWELVQEERLGRSESRQTPKTAEVGDSSGWVCKACTLHNRSGVSSCDACGTKRSTDGAGESKGNKNAQVIDLTADSPPKTTARDSGAGRNGGGERLSNQERPSHWQCRHCGILMERQWWTCSSCGQLKADSK